MSTIGTPGAKSPLRHLAVGTVLGLAVTGGWVALITLMAEWGLVSEEAWLIVGSVVVLTIAIPYLALRVGRAEPLHGWGVLIGMSIVLGGLALIIMLDPYQPVPIPDGPRLP